MKYLNTLLLGLLPYIMDCKAEEQKFGLVATEDKNLCVSFGDTPPLVKSPITIVAVEGVQSVFEAKIGERIENCNPLKEAQVKGPYFTVTTNGKYANNFVGVAVYGKTNASIKGGVVVLSAARDEENIFFRLCTSAEGLYFSSWLGQPLVGKRIWHQYFYLGYDIEPTCGERDFRMEEKPGKSL